MTPTRAARRPWFRDRWRWPRWMTREVSFMSELPQWGLRKRRGA